MCAIEQAVKATVKEASCACTKGMDAALGLNFASYASCPPLGLRGVREGAIDAVWRETACSGRILSGLFLALT